MKRYSKLIKLFLVIIGALIFTEVVAYEVFIADSPKIKHNLGAYLIAKINLIFSPKSQYDQSALASNYDETIKKLEKVPFTQVAKGVYAKSNGFKSITITYLDQVPMKIYTFNVNGKEYKVHVPVESSITEDQVRQNLENSPM